MIKSKVEQLASWYSSKARARRAELFMNWLAPSEGDRILDLGSEDGKYIASVVPFRKNVTIADIDPEALARGHELYGFETALIGEDGRLPFEDGAFDIVHCSSVIEHVTLPKEELETVTSTSEFREISLQRQAEFAAEVARVGKRYYVQTPNRYFWIESHTWLPGVVAVLPRRAQLWLVSKLDGRWPKTTQADWNLLRAEELAKMFPGASIERERSLGLTKSLMAVSR